MMGASMTKYVVGQNYGWNGGECPVHPKTKIQIWTRDALGCSAVNTVAHYCAWKHRQDGGDIVCFQVIEPYAEPKTIYMNEFDSGAMECFYSEAEAKKWVCPRHTRIAVKYVEVKE